MRLDLTGFSPPQQDALLELLILAMYADGRLSVWEEAWLQELMHQMGYVDEAVRQRTFDAILKRILPVASHVDSARQHALQLAVIFQEPRQQGKVFATMEWIMGSDGHLSTWEKLLLSELRCRFNLPG